MKPLETAAAILAILAATTATTHAILQDRLAITAVVTTGQWTPLHRDAAICSAENADAEATPKGNYTLLTITLQGQGSAKIELLIQLETGNIPAKLEKPRLNTTSATVTRAEILWDKPSQDPPPSHSELCGQTGTEDWPHEARINHTIIIKLTITIGEPAQATAIEITTPSHPFNTQS